MTGRGREIPPDSADVPRIVEHDQESVLDGHHAAGLPPAGAPEGNRSAIRASASRTSSGTVAGRVTADPPCVSYWPVITWVNIVGAAPRCRSRPDNQLG